MTHPGEKTLLPEGLRDTLPPDAENEARLTEDLLAHFLAAGYARIKPPLVEFEDSLLAGSGAEQSPFTFRIMDPVSHRMMGVRADMTIQVARIGMTRLINQPRPLRLCYAGDVLRVKGSQLHPQRQFVQAGVELIGSDARAADVEVVMLALEALRAMGVQGLSVDLTLPGLVPALCAGAALSEDETTTAIEAMNAKDGAAVAQLDGAIGEKLRTLLDMTGPLDDAEDLLGQLDLSGEAALLLNDLKDLAADLMAADDTLDITLDPGDSRGFHYYTGAGFAVFAKKSRFELGRGGRYSIQLNDEVSETAVGFSLFIDSLMHAVTPPEAVPTVFVSAGESRDTVAALKSDGWRVVAGLEESADDKEEARRLRCTHIWTDGKIEPLS